MRIWVADWELQCCGEPFSVGDEVSWTLSNPDDAGDLSIIGVDRSYLRHDPGVVVRLRLTTIAAVWVRFRTGGDRVLVPIEGSETVEPRSRADGWERDRGPAERFVGYLVTADPEAP